MAEKRNPLNRQDHPHHEGTEQNTPSRSRPQEGKKENAVGSKKASSSPKNRDARKQGDKDVENAAGEP